MANSRKSVTIFSPSSKRPTKRTRSSITEHSFQGITPSPRGGSVTHVSGTNCHPCVRPLTYVLLLQSVGFSAWCIFLRFENIENKTSATRSTARRCESGNHTAKIWLVRSMKRAKFLWTDGVAVCANCLHGLASAPNIHLFQDSMDVIPHRKLRKVQVRSDFLICETLGHESDQLLLAQSKIGPRSRVLERHRAGRLSDETK